jgi:hypothetical protein
MSVYEYDTLAYHAKERPGTMLRSVAHVPLKTVGKAVRESISKVGAAVRPEREAITFYLLNHAMHEIGLQRNTDEPLGDMLPVVEQYHHALNNLGYRMFNYLMAIVTREMRHLSSGKDNQIKGDHINGPALSLFTNRVRSQAQDALYTTDLEVPVGEYLDWVVAVYNDIPWGGSFGGKRWGTIAKCIRDCVYGETSIEMMLDVGYTLAHNTAPIFNKGMHYKHNGSYLVKILDVQRGGQIPQLVKGKAVSEVEKGHQKLLELCEQVIPGFTVNPWVNWALVEKLGALQSYSSEKAHTEQQYGHLPTYQAEQQEIVVQVKAVKEAQAAKKAAEEGMYIEIMPGVKLKKGVMARG